MGSRWVSVLTLSQESWHFSTGVLRHVVHLTGTLAVFCVGSMRGESVVGNADQGFSRLLDQAGLSRYVKPDSIVIPVCTGLWQGPLLLPASACSLQVQDKSVFLTYDAST